LPAVTRPCGRNGAAQCDADQRLLDHAVGVGPAHPLLAERGVRVGALARDGGVAVVDVLRRRTHDQGGGVDEVLGHEARVDLGVEAHRVVRHVLHAAGDRDVVRAERDPRRDAGDGGHGAGAHPVDRVARHGARQPGEQRRRPSQGQALVADLGGRRDRDLVDPLGRQLGVAPHQLADAIDDEVVGAGLGVHRAGLAERGADAVDEDDLTRDARHGRILLVGNFVRPPHDRARFASASEWNAAGVWGSSPS
jgi:hypothetical protein